MLHSFKYVPLIKNIYKNLWEVQGLENIIKVSKNKQRLSKCLANLSNKNKQRLWKLGKLETSLFFTALLIKYTKCSALREDIRYVEVILMIERANMAGNKGKLLTSFWKQGRSQILNMRGPCSLGLLSHSK